VVWITHARSTTLDRDISAGDPFPSNERIYGDRNERPRTVPNVVLIIGSAPDAVRSKDWPRSSFDSIVVINNAWAVRPDWDYLIHPDDFPDERLPRDKSLGLAAIIKSGDFVPAQNAFGGFVYAGGTMAFTAGYWALKSLRPDIIAFLACDMIYPRDRPTHFYGVGTADPLRDDVTLRDLKAKSARLFAKALRQGTICLNLSNLPESRLALPRATLPFIDRLTPRRFDALRVVFEAAIDQPSIEQAGELETALGYHIEDGRYWQHLSDFDEAALAQLDQHWTQSVSRLSGSIVPTCWRRGWSSPADAIPSPYRG
jgi:hypothetical protein